MPGSQISDNISANTRPKSKILGVHNTGPMTNTFLCSTQKIGSLDCPFKWHQGAENSTATEE